MDSLVQADIFFFVTTVVVCIVAALAAAALLYAIMILRDVRDITSKVRAEGDAIAQDIAAARRFVKSEGARLASAIMFLVRLFKIKRTAKRDSDRGGKEEG